MPCNYFRPLSSSRLRLYSLLPSPVVVRKQNPSTPFISYTKLPAFIPHRGRFSSICMHGNYCVGPESAPFPFYSASRLPHSIITSTGTGCQYGNHPSDYCTYPSTFHMSFRKSKIPSVKIESAIYLHAFQIFILLYEQQEREFAIT